MQQKFAELRQKLERWKAHNEVHAKPADQALYEFLNALLNIADEKEGLSEYMPPISEAPQAASAEDETGPGGNSPSGTPDLP